MSYKDPEKRAAYKREWNRKNKKPRTTKQEREKKRRQRARRCAKGLTVRGAERKVPLHAHRQELVHPPDCFCYDCLFVGITCADRRAKLTGVIWGAQCVDEDRCAKRGVIRVSYNRGSGDYKESTQ